MEGTPCFRRHADAFVRIFVRILARIFVSRLGREMVAVAVLLATLFVSKGAAQLQITELMYDSRSSEPDWEWIEVFNAYESDYDLDGYVLDDRSTSASQDRPSIVTLVDDTTSVNTIVPAGGVAVLYNGPALEFNEGRFRAAWELNDSIPLIAVSRWPSLNNGGDAIGLWVDLDTYASDLDNVDDDEDLEVAQFGHAASAIDYSLESFPRGGEGRSIQWMGEGDAQAGENWVASEESTSWLSVATQLPDVAINDVRDIGNPGQADLVGGDSLVISEIMYNPASSEPDWEWVELYNATDKPVDFELTPYFLDDRSDSQLTEGNIRQGSIEPGEVGILFSDDNSPADLMAAWGEGNYIPVSDWSSLNNNGDLVAIWSDPLEYAADGELPGDRLADGAVSAVEYLDGNGAWPNVGQGNSISLLEVNPEFSNGENWVLNEEGDGWSRFAEPVISSRPDHVGDDWGAPGVVGSMTPPDLQLDLNQNGVVDADDASLVCDRASADVGQWLHDRGYSAGDFDLDGDVDFADFLNLSANFGQQAAVDYARGDADCRDGVGFADFLLLSRNFGAGSIASTVPEPRALVLSGWIALLCMGRLRSSRRRAS